MNAWIQVVLPMAVSVARVQQVFDDQGNCQDPDTEKHIRSAATNLIEYIRSAICPRVTLEAIVRQSQEPDSEQH